jgi:hypothetical protein
LAINSSITGRAAGDETAAFRREDQPDSADNLDSKLPCTASAFAVVDDGGCARVCHSPCENRRLAGSEIPRGHLGWNPTHGHHLEPRRGIDGRHCGFGLSGADLLEHNVGKVDDSGTAFDQT